MKKTIIGIVIVLAIGIGYYLISPLFRTVVVYDEAPQASEVKEVTEMPSPAKKSPVIGTVGHPATGTVSVIAGAEGPVIRYEDFETINGPDLYVYLAKDLEAKEFINLGEAKGTKGNINYEVPAGVDLAEYRYVLTWCKQFRTLFNYAEI